MCVCVGGGGGGGFFFFYRASEANVSVSTAAMEAYCTNPTLVDSHLHRQGLPRLQRWERPLAGKEGTVGEKCPVILSTFGDFHAKCRDFLHAANLRHGADGFTFPPKGGTMRIYSPWKIRRLRPGTRGQRANHYTTEAAWGRGVNVTPRPVYLRDWPVAHCVVQWMGPVWTGKENHAPTGIRSPDSQARSKSLCRLSYLGPHSSSNTVG
jgi:hypothetical protein